MRKTSAPAANSRPMTAAVRRGRAQRRHDLGPPLPPHRLWLPGGAVGADGAGARAGGWRRAQRIAGRQRLLRRLLARFGELHGPGALLAGIDLEKAGAVVAARQAIADAADRELLVAGAHVGLSHPFAAAIVVDGVDIIITRDEIALEHGLAGARRQVPPAFRGPAVGILVADGDADAARRVVAQPEIGRRRRAPTRPARARHERGSASERRLPRFPGNKSPALISGSDSGQRSWPVNDDGAEVGHVGERRAGPEQIADAVEKPRGIVVGEKRGGIEAGGPGALKRRRVDKGAGRVVRAAAAAVGSVGIGGQRRDARRRRRDGWRAPGRIPGWGRRGPGRAA